MCQLFQYYSTPDLNWQSNISYSLRSCPPYISIHVFSKTGKNPCMIRGFIRKGTQSMEILRVYVRDLREIKTSSKLQTNQQCCYITLKLASVLNNKPDKKPFLFWIVQSVFHVRVFLQLFLPILWGTDKITESNCQRLQPCFFNPLSQ